MFAVIKTGGKQYRVAAEDKLKVEKVAGAPGEIIQFADVLVVGGDSVTLGNPTVSGASVAAEVLDQGRGPKVIAFKKRRRKNSRRKRGHRQEFTLIRITEILTDGAKPTIGARPKRERKPAAGDRRGRPDRRNRRGTEGQKPRQNRPQKPRQQRSRPPRPRKSPLRPSLQANVKRSDGSPAIQLMHSSLNRAME